MKKIRIFLLILGATVLPISLIGQKINGIVIDSENKLPLAYVNIGVIDISKGSITNDKGKFSLDCEKLPNNSKIQLSMIGYKIQIFDISDFTAEIDTIELEKKPIELNEVTIKWEETTKQIGTTKTFKMAGVCGWGGTDFGKGHELGLLLEIGENPVKVENVNFKIRKHSYDTITFRLHIRSIVNGLPLDEILTENIFLTITKYNGWQKIDLSQYNIVLSGNVALSLEWIKISNIIEKNMIRMNGAKEATPNVLFETSNKGGTIFMRRGSAAIWKKEENTSPGFYITVRE
jgi:hypothetical protein